MPWVKSSGFGYGGGSASSRLTGFHDSVGGAEDSLRAFLGQFSALQPALDVETALGLAGQTVVVKQVVA